MERLMKNNDFFNVPRTYYTTSYTRTQVPMFFFKLDTRMLNYFLDYNACREKLRGTGLVPVRFFNGKALVSLIFYDYIDVTIGPYQEVTIVIVAYPESQKKPILPMTKVLFCKKGSSWGTMGGYVLEMPVTTPAARAAGREIWGYPKFLANIPYSLYGRKFEFQVVDRSTEEFIVSVTGETGPGISQKGFDLVSYTNYESDIWKIIVDVDARVKICTCSMIEVKTGSGNHRMARNIRDLGFERTKPFIIICADGCRTRLNAGRPVASWMPTELPYSYKEEKAFHETIMELGNDPKQS